MKVNYHLNRTKRSSWLALLPFMVCTIIMIGISPYTSISPVPREVWADSVIATIPVGNLPVLIAFNPDNGNMYVANHDSDTVSVIDGQTNTVIGSPISVGDGPGGIAFNSDNGDMYVTNYLDDTVSVIQTSTPSESIQNLIDTINDLDINKRAKTSLTASLKIAIRLLTDDNPDNDKAPCRILDAFLATVHSFEAIKQLTSLQAELLSQQAIAIKNSLRCDEVTCTCPPKGSEQSLTDEFRSKGITILDLFS